MVGENFDVNNPPDSDQLSENARKSLRFLGVTFACCQVYTRVYLNHEETAYVGNCPKCQKQVTLQIGPGGTDSRFFTAY